MQHDGPDPVRLDPDRPAQGAGGGDFRRPTKVFQDGLAANPANIYLLTLDGVIASEGGIPIMQDGKIIGAIGCSGGTGAQDGQACKAGADTSSSQRRFAARVRARSVGDGRARQAQKPRPPIQSLA